MNKFSSKNAVLYLPINIELAVPLKIFIMEIPQIEAEELHNKSCIRAVPKVWLQP